MADPLQLPLFPDQASLTPIRPERAYGVSTRWRFGPTCSAAPCSRANGGRISTQGRVRLDPHSDAGAAINSLARIARAKRRRGYQNSSA